MPFSATLGAGGPVDVVPSLGAHVLAGPRAGKQTITTARDGGGRGL